MIPTHPTRVTFFLRFLYILSYRHALSKNILRLSLYSLMQVKDINKSQQERRQVVKKTLGGKAINHLHRMRPDHGFLVYQNHWARDEEVTPTRPSWALIILQVLLSFLYLKVVFHTDIHCPKSFLRFLNICSWWDSIKLENVPYWTGAPICLLRRYGNQLILLWQLAYIVIYNYFS